jgi:DNA-binding Xre family transcriptional regulator
VNKERLEIFWNLGNLLYQHKILKVKDFQDLMRDHGVNLSYAQTYHLVHEQPLRVTLRNVLAICDMLKCSVSDLIILRKAAYKEPDPKKEVKTSGEGKIKRLPRKTMGPKVIID